MDGIIENQTCPTVGYQAASVCVPVTITPYANAGATVTKCCGEAIVVPGRQLCGGIKNESCSFTLSQNICVAVPVDFGASATVGEAFVVSGRIGKRYLHRVQYCACNRGKSA